MKPEDLTAQALGANGTIALYCLNRDLVIQTVNLELDRVGMGRRSMLSSSTCGRPWGHPTNGRTPSTAA